MVRGGPFELGGHTIPRGHRDQPVDLADPPACRPSIPQPREFRPERFLGDDAPDTYTWIPFGGGTRRCLGAAFAQFEMRVVIERVLARTRLEAVGRRPEAVARRGITLVPKRGTRVVVRERRPAPAAATVAALHA